MTQENFRMLISSSHPLPSCALTCVIIIILPILSLVNCEQLDKEKDGQKSSVNRLIVISSVDGDSINYDSFVRFNRSIEAYNLSLELLRADSIDSYARGLSTLDLREKNRRRYEALQAILSSHKNDKNSILMLIDSANSIVNGNEQAILSRFEEFHRANGTQILFSADRNCWPDASLAEQYPNVPRDQQRYLSSRSLIGFAPALWELITVAESLVDKSNYDFQLYTTYVYLSLELRDRLKLELDHRSSLFENLDLAGKANATSPSDVSEQTSSPLTSVELEFVHPPDAAAAAADEVILKNLIHNSRPLVVHGSGGHARIELNSLGNYLGRAWTPGVGCRHCNSSMISLASIKDSDLPIVLIGVFIEEATPFMANFFEALKELNYPKNRIHLLVHNAIEYHEQHVSAFMGAHGSQYASQQLIDNFRSSQWQPPPLGPTNEWEAREFALRKCAQVGCEYYLSLDSVARLEWPDSLRALIETNRTIVAPMLSRPGKLWSNFWGSMTRDGYYARSHDYVELVARERIGIWNVPLVMNAYLIEGKFLRSQLRVAGAVVEAGAHQTAGAAPPTSPPPPPRIALSYHDDKFPTVKPVLIFARNLRAASGVFQYVTNVHDFGHLIDPSDYNTTLRYPDLYQLEQNRHDWEREYLHENYTDLFDERDEDEKNYPDRIRLEEPCRDVYWFPLVNEKFCDQLVDMMERFGQWSSGTTHDPRIEGGYESVPTRDIHFKQVGLHNLWLFFLREYVMPVQLKEYIGYEHDPPRTDLAFVVRYNPAEQPSLRPHHDSSTYTLNIALNAPGRDYEGGGCRFVRYNCSVTESRKGWALIHPGRLTHYHEGLPVTRGTRYILVTFIDP